MTRHARTVLAGVAAVSLVALAQLVDPATGKLELSIDPSLTRLLPEVNEFDAYAQELFERRDVILVVLAADPIFARTLVAQSRLVSPGPLCCRQV